MSQTRRIRNESTESTGKWHLVEFVEDGLLLVCSSEDTTIKKGVLLAKWPGNGKWYEAVIKKTGGKQGLISRYKKTAFISSHEVKKSRKLKKDEKPTTDKNKKNHCEILPQHKNLSSFTALDVKENRDGILSHKKLRTLNHSNEDCQVEEVGFKTTEKIASISNTSDVTCQKSPEETSNVQCQDDISSVQDKPFDLQEQKNLDQNPQIEMNTEGTLHQIMYNASEPGPSRNVLEISSQHFNDNEHITDEISLHGFIDRPCLLENTDGDIGNFTVQSVVMQQEDTLQYLLEEMLPSLDIVNDYDLVDELPTFSAEMTEKSSEIEQVTTTAHCTFVSKCTHTDSQKAQNNVISTALNPENVTFNVQVDLASKNENNISKRNWDKKYVCCFCKKSYAKLPRHFEDLHAENPEVAMFLSMPKSSKERKQKLEELRNRGCFKHNTATLKSGKGKIIPKRRPTTPNSPSKYLPCEICYGFFARKFLARHFRDCAKKHAMESSAVRNRNVCTKSQLMLPSTQHISNEFKDMVLAKMTDDDIFQIVSNDELILQFGLNMYEKLCHEKRNNRLIVNRLRELGRLVHAANKVENTVTKLEHILKPSKFTVAKEAVRKVARFDEMKNCFETPSLALKLGMSLKKCAVVLKGLRLENGNSQEEIDEIKNFIELMEMRWSTEISSKAHRTLTERKWNAPKKIPLAEDIKKLNKYLLNRDQVLSLEIINSSTPIRYAELIEVTLCRTLILNRRRVGEMQFMRLSDYMNAPNVDNNSEVFATLSNAEKVLVKTLKRIEIRGKKGRKVPVILTVDLQETISLLIQKRKECGVDDGNIFLFPALNNSDGHHRADVLLRKYARLCGATNPDCLTSTRLRKHVATLTQLLNLREHELDAVANFMGHDIRIHRQYYRLSEDTMELAKIGKLLINMDKGNVSLMKNKNLDEIIVSGEVSDFEDEVEDEPSNILHSEPSISDCSSKKAKTSSKKCAVYNKTQRRPWSVDETKAVRNYFKGHIQLKKVPCKKEIDEFIQKHGEIVNTRTWKDIKYSVYNAFKCKIC